MDGLNCRLSFAFIAESYYTGGSYSPEPIFPKQWYIGTGGKLFRLLKFLPTVPNDHSRARPLISWMCKYNLDKLPQLFNVLRGEISLRDLFCPLTISEAVMLGSEG